MPYPLGLAGVVALHTPPTIVPGFVAPQEFALEVQAIIAAPTLTVTLDKGLTPPLAPLHIKL